MRTTALAVVSALALGGCSHEFDSEALKLKYHPPRGASLAEEKAGPPRVARFTLGLELRSVDGAPPAIDEGRLADLLKEVAEKAGTTPPGELISSRAGSIPAGPVARWALRDPEGRTVIYYVPGKARFLLITQRASEAAFGEAENQLELSMGTLKLRE